MSIPLIDAEFAKVLAPFFKKEGVKVIRDFDRDDLPPITHCPDCGYDGEGLEYQITEIKRIMLRFDSGQIDEVDCLSAISNIIEEEK